MVTIGIDPVIFQIGHFAVRWYGMAMLAAILIGFVVTLVELSRRRVPLDGFINAFPWIVLIAIVGARLAHVVDLYEYFLANPLAIVAINEGGLANYGIIAGGFAGLVGISMWKRMPLWKILDAGAPALALGQVVGRIGCLINADAWGPPTGGNWGLVYTHPGAMLPADLLGVPTHPTPVYEMLWNGLGFAILWKLRKRVKSDGVLFLGYVAYYSIGRFIITYYRQTDIFAFGLREAQVIAVATLVVVVPALIFMALRRPSQVDAPVEEQAPVTS